MSDHGGYICLKPRHGTSCGFCDPCWAFRVLTWEIYRDRDEQSHSQCADKLDRLTGRGAGPCISAIKNAKAAGEPVRKVHAGVKYPAAMPEVEREYESHRFKALEREMLASAPCGLCGLRGAHECIEAPSTLGSSAGFDARSVTA